MRKIRIVVCVSFFIFCASLVTYAKDNISLERQLQEARAFFHQGEQAKSLIMANHILDAFVNKEKSHSDSVFLMNVQFLCGQSYIALGNGTKGLSLLKTSMDYAKQLNDSKFLGQTYNSLFNVYYSAQDYDSAYDLLVQAIELSVQNKDERNLIRLYNNLGLVYYARGDFQKALKNMKEALSYTVQKDGLERSQIYTNMAEVYYKQNLYDDAESWLSKAINSMNGKVNGASIQTYLNMALVKAKLGKTGEVRAYQKSIYSVIPSLPLPAKVNSMRQLADINLVIGDSLKSLRDMLQYDILADSLRHLDNNTQLRQLLVAYDTDRLSQHNAALQQSLKTRNILTYGSLAFLLVVISFSVLLWLRMREDKRKTLLIAKQKESLLKYEQKEHERKQKQMSLELEHKSRQLTSYTIDLAAVNEFHQKMSMELQNLDKMIDENLPMDAASRSSIFGQSNKLANMLAHFNDKPVNEDFRIFFEEVHPNFLKNLSQTYPKLSENDLRLCAYIFLGMSTKEIAALTYREIRSVESSRNRLRKKLELEPGADVRAFLVAKNALFNNMQ